MSSKLHRWNEISTEPIAWPRVPSLDGSPIEAGLFPSAAQTPPASGAANPGGLQEKHLQEAYQRGFQDSQIAARKESGEQLDAMASRLARTIEELSGMRQRFRHEAEEEVIALALAIARRILHRELTVAPEALAGLLKAALEKIEAREVHRVRVRPEDVPRVQQHLDRMGLPQNVELIGDPALERGAIILDSSRGALDASVDTQLAEIERGFADLMRRT